MPTELREAKIRVILDLEDSKDAADSLEDRVKKTRKEQEDEERKTGRPGKGEPTKKIALRQLKFGQITNSVRQVLESIPLLGVFIAAGIGAAEANERLGPGAEAFLKSLTPEWLKPIMKELGLDMELAADMAKWYGENKSYLTSITAGADRATAMAAAIARTGGHITPGEAWDEFKLQREMAENLANIEKARRRILQMKAGAGVGEAMKRALDNAGRPPTGK